MKRGLVIGKFYPFHAGHQHLIDTALSMVDHLTIIVTGKRGQTIKPEVRAGWIREIYPQTTVKVAYHNLPARHDEKWAIKTIEWAGFKPDIFFTSEPREQRYAKIMGAKLVMVDTERKKVPISGTKIRKKPLDHQELLHPIVRTYIEKNFKNNKIDEKIL